MRTEVEFDFAVDQVLGAFGRMKLGAQIVGSGIAMLKQERDNHRNGRIDALKKLEAAEVQRDELIAALEKVPYCIHWEDARAIVNEALAKV